MVNLSVAVSTDVRVLFIIFPYKTFQNLFVSLFAALKNERMRALIRLANSSLGYMFTRKIIY